MFTRSLFLLTITALATRHSTAFVINKPSDEGEGVNELADALRVMEETRGDSPEQNEKLREELGEFSPPGFRDYNNYNSDYTDIDQEEMAKLLESYYDNAYDSSNDIGGNPDVKADEKEVAPEKEHLQADEKIKPADKAEIENLLAADDKEKKNVDWTPKALGFEGLKHKRNGNDVTDVKIEEIQNEAKNADDKAGVLSDKQVKDLLSDTKDAEVKAVSNEIHVENVNGKETVSANEIVDILKDDGEGHKKEFIIESKVPEQQPGAGPLNKELVVEEVPQDAGAITIKRKRANEDPLIEEEDGGQTDFEEGDEDIPSESDLLRQCLMAYIKLEDNENTALAEALNWATKAQYEQTDAYIPFQIEQIRNAVVDEETLVELRRQCFGLADEMNDDNNIATEKRSEPETVEEDQPLFEDYNDTDDETNGGDEEVLNEEQSAYPVSHYEVAEEAPPESRIREEEEIAYIQSELRKELIRQGLHLPGGYQESDSDWMSPDEDEEDESGVQWLQTAVNEPPRQDEWYLNPLLRDLVRKYQRSNFEKRGVEREYEPAVCPAVDSLTDNCAQALESGLLLDEEARELCDRHQVCYTCGAALGMSPKTCDKGFLREAYLRCATQFGPQETCAEQADLLLEVMFQTHDYQPLEQTPYECLHSCTMDYITNGEIYA